MKYIEYFLGSVLWFGALYVVLTTVALALQMIFKLKGI